MPNNKLSDHEEIVRLMKKGWELGLSTGWSCRYWLQKGGLCRGGESRNCHASTVTSMMRKELIERAPKKPKDGFWLVRFKLKGKGS